MTSISNTALNLPKLLAPIGTQLVASSLLLGLLSTLSTPINANASLAPLVAQSPSAATTNTVQTRLQGRWQVEDPSSRQKLVIIFTPDGKLLMLLPLGSSKESVPVSFGYRINATPKPMHLDVLLPEGNQTVMTIFDFTPDNQLRLQLAGTEPGQPRPKAFAANALLLHKVSDTTTLPENTQSNNLTEAVKRAQQAEGKQNTGAMSRAQQAYYLENEKFTTKIEELGIGIKSETENYSYKILPQGNQRQSVMMTAQAKRPGLRSYTGAVFVVKSNDERLTVAQLCETDEPSMTPPAMPATPRTVSAEIQCATGSHSAWRR